ncbi:MAG: hypothetical protein ACOC1W_00200 [Bacillota bacterium]
MGLVKISREYRRQSSKRALKFQPLIRYKMNVDYKIKDLESLNNKQSRPSGKFKLIEKTKEAAEFSNNYNSKSN